MPVSSCTVHALWNQEKRKDLPEWKERKGKKNRRRTERRRRKCGIFYSWGQDPRSIAPRVLLGLTVKFETRAKTFWAPFSSVWDWYERPILCYRREAFVSLIRKNWKSWISFHHLAAGLFCRSYPTRELSTTLNFVEKAKKIQHLNKLKQGLLSIP